MVSSLTSCSTRGCTSRWRRYGAIRRSADTHGDSSLSWPLILMCHRTPWPYCNTPLGVLLPCLSQPLLAPALPSTQHSGGKTDLSPCCWMLCNSSEYRTFRRITPPHSSAVHADVGPCFGPITSTAHLEFISGRCAPATTALSVHIPDSEGNRFALPDFSRCDRPSSLLAPSIRCHCCGSTSNRTEWR